MGHLQDMCINGEGLAPVLADSPADFRPLGWRRIYRDESSDPETKEILLEHRDFQVRLASTRGRRSKSSMLVNRMYSWRGYKQLTQDETSLGANQITLQACRKETVFGTLSLCFDSDSGLAADALYRAEVDAYRLTGAKVCEITRLAIDPEHGSKDVLGALFHLAYIFGGVLRGATDVFIEVNPRHVAFYRRMLNFSQAGSCRICERVNAPAVLLHLEAAYVAKQIALYGGHQGGAKRSLYPYFFSAKEEKGLARRIGALAD